MNITINSSTAAALPETGSRPFRALLQEIVEYSDRVVREQDMRYCDCGQLLRDRAAALLENPHTCEARYAEMLGVLCARAATRGLHRLEAEALDQYHRARALLSSLNPAHDSEGLARAVMAEAAARNMGEDIQEGRRAFRQRYSDPEASALARRLRGNG